MISLERQIQKVISGETALTEASYNFGKDHKVLKSKYKEKHKMTIGGRYMTDVPKDAKKVDDTTFTDGKMFYHIVSVSEELELVDEARGSDYEVYHKDFSSAVQHAWKQAEKRGYEIDKDDWDDKVATGPKRPSSGKTNSYHIDLMKNGKPEKKKLHMQVYNMDNKKYELNMYIEGEEFDGEMIKEAYSNPKAKSAAEKIKAAVKKNDIRGYALDIVHDAFEKGDDPKEVVQWASGLVDVSDDEKFNKKVNTFKFAVIKEIDKIRKEARDKKTKVSSISEAALFNKSHLDRLRKEYGKLDKINPDGSAYKKLVDFLDNMNQTRLKQIADANIKFLSPLARNRLTKVSKGTNRGRGVDASKVTSSLERKQEFYTKLMKKKNNDSKKDTKEEVELDEKSKFFSSPPEQKGTSLSRFVGGKKSKDADWSKKDDDNKTTKINKTGSRLSDDEASKIRKAIVDAAKEHGRVDAGTGSTIAYEVLRMARKGPINQKMIADAAMKSRVHDRYARIMASKVMDEIKEDVKEHNKPFLMEELSEHFKQRRDKAITESGKTAFGKLIEGE